ncbi:uncharacterized protein LOC126109653 [Schistocerca cancellata]|uniref:uncharacterized protein LOC126109653 n=1 Tax=Schistocerca cancellata TaxID=274614 RepID=UPI002117571A|nr:uncharacterized protein LOC126109653 [Schistocerca cancellata]
MAARASSHHTRYEINSVLGTILKCLVRHLYIHVCPMLLPCSNIQCLHCDLMFNCLLTEPDTECDQQGFGMPWQQELPHTTPEPDTECDEQGFGMPWQQELPHTTPGDSLLKRGAGGWSRRLSGGQCGS